MTLTIKPVHNESDWERFVGLHSPQSLFQSWTWGEVQQNIGKTVHRVALYEGSSIVGVAQIVSVHAKRGTFLHIRHGPIWREQRESYWRDLIPALDSIITRERAWFVRISPLVHASEVSRISFEQLGYQEAAIHAMDAEHCWVLDLTKGENELLMAMRKTTRYEIRRAQKMGIRIVTSTDPKDMTSFFALYDETSKRHGFVQHEGIEEEFALFARKDKAVLLLGYHDDRLIAGAIILFYGNQAIYHHGASVTSKIPGSYLVQWEAILEARKRNVPIYNFWGIAPDESHDHPWEGITLFKKGFGGRMETYVHAKDYPVSPLYIIPKTVETIRKKMRGY